MQCPSCGSELKPGSLFCEGCGREIQIVPDYDPLDELLIGQEKSEETEQKEKSNKQDEKPVKQTTPGTDTSSEHKRKQLRIPGKWLRVLAGLAICLGVFLLSYYSISRGSKYSYQLEHGVSLVNKEKYEEAIPYLKKAQELQSRMDGADPKPLQYLGLAYAHLGDGDSAEEYIKKAIRLENDNPDLYLDYMKILNLTGRTEKINGIIENCENKEIRMFLLPYRIEKPSVNLREGTYSHYIKLELEADFGVIYYTLDGTPPTQGSTRYDEPIELLEEGETLLSAVAVNKKGIISDELVLVYKLEFDNDNDMNEEE